MMRQQTAEISVNNLNDCISVHNDQVTVEDSDRLRQSVIDTLVNGAVFGNSSTRQLASFLIWESGLCLGIQPASIHELYMAARSGELAGRTVPAINIRGLTYDVARSVFRSAIKHNTGAFIFEIARSEIGYTNQRPLEYATVVIAAAIKEGYSGPIFIQGDHFQVKTAAYGSNPEKEIAEVKSLIKEAIDAGFYNIDIDTSTLVDMSKGTVAEQQQLNYLLSAQLTSYIRQHQPDGITIAVGGEIGEVGGKNSTVEELEAYLDNYRTALNGYGPDLTGLSKVSVQTGTTHGGVVLADGSIAQVKIDFDTLRELSHIARNKYGLGGAVQHGASTLPDKAFHHFPDTDTCEVHLATGFQNIIFDHPALPATLKDRIHEYLYENFSGEKKDGQSDTQFLYKTRKKGFGPFKKEWWNLPEDIRERINTDLEERFAFLFKKLNVTDTKELVKTKVNAVPAHKKRPL